MGLLLFFFSSFFFVSRFFVKDISTTVLNRNFKFCIHVYNDKLYRRIENGPSPICSSLYLFFFLSLQIFPQRYLHGRLRLKLQIGIEVCYDKLYCGIANGPSPICCSLYFLFLFVFVHFFLLMHSVL